MADLKVQIWDAGRVSSQVRHLLGEIAFKGLLQYLGIMEVECHQCVLNCIQGHRPSVVMIPSIFSNLRDIYYDVLISTSNTPRRPPTQKHPTILQQSRHILHLLPIKHRNRPPRLQNRDRRPLTRLRHHNLHARQHPLRHRPLRHRTRHPRPHHQTRRTNPLTTPIPPRRRLQTQRLRLHRAPQTL